MRYGFYLPTRGACATPEAIETFLQRGEALGFDSVMAAPDFDRRGAASDEYIRIYKTLWTKSPASFAGDFYRFDELRCEPLPVQKPHPPLWIGGHSKPALRRAARLGDGWHPVGANPAVPLRPAELRASLDELCRLTELEGRDPKAVTISFKAPVYDTTLATAGEARRPFSGSAEEIVDDIATYARLGVSELIFDFRSEHLPESIERMEHFAATIMCATRSS
ncbi:MAG: LLM class flavin-dependent oxidoreductase [Candidatus Rokuibacteriota bacterium]